MNWYIEYGGVYNINGEKVFGRKKYIDADKFDMSICDKFNNIDVYTTNFLYNNKDQNDSDLYGPLYLDLDGDIDNEQSFNKVKIDTLLVISFLHDQLKVPFEYIQIYFSGSKGFHLLVSQKVFGLKSCKDLNVKYKKIATEANKNTFYKSVDTRIYDKKRLIRLPHTINSKSGLYKVPITLNALKAMSYKVLKSYAEIDRHIDFPDVETVEAARQAFDTVTKVEEVKREKRTIAINPDYEIPNCIKMIWKNGAVKGARNNTLIILSSAIMQKGTSVEDCIDLMNDWNKNNEPPISENEIETTVRSAYRNLLDGRRYGCSSIKDLGYCLGDKCKLYR